MTSVKDIEKWVALLPPANKQIPKLLKVTQDFYVKLQTCANKRTFEEYGIEDWRLYRYSAIKVVVKEDLEVSWILFDQYGNEMKRAE